MTLNNAPIAVVAGGTGLTGSFLVKRLLNDASIGGVISVSRRPIGLTTPKLREVRISTLADLPTVASQLGGQLYFSCLGTTIKAAGSQRAFEDVDHDAVLAFANIAAANRARSLVIVSAMGADARSRIFYNRVKGRTEDDVTALGLRSLTLFRPALLVGPRVDHRLAERVASMTLVPIARVLPRKIRRSLITDVARLANEMVIEAQRATPGTRIIRASEI